MSETLDRVRSCATSGSVVGSVHGLKRIDENGIVFEDLLSSLTDAVPVEDYPDAERGPSVLALHRLPDGFRAHAVWAFATGRDNIAVLVTAYVPEPSRWSADFMTRRPR